MCMCCTFQRVILYIISGMKISDIYFLIVYYSNLILLSQRKHVTELYA